jgi:hypothetical protein
MKFIAKAALFGAAFAFMLKGVYASGVIPEYPGILRSSLQKIEAGQIYFDKQFFASKDAVSKIAYFYKARLSSSGWQEVAAEKHSPGLCVFQKPGRQIQLTLWRDRKNLVTYAELTHSVFFPKVKMIAGNDLVDVPRYPASKRVLFMEREDGNTLVLAYASASPLALLYYYYRAHMQNLGWKYNAFFDLLPQKSSQRILMFEAAGKECMVSISENAGKSGAVIFILYRKGIEG